MTTTIAILVSFILSVLLYRAHKHLTMDAATIHDNLSRLYDMEAQYTKALRTIVRDREVLDRTLRAAARMQEDISVAERHCTELQIRHMLDMAVADSEHKAEKQAMMKAIEASIELDPETPDWRNN